MTAHSERQRPIQQGMIGRADETVHRIDEVIADLRAAGLTEAAQRLEEVQRTAYTTGSEWRGEVARAALSICRSRDCPRELRSRVRRLLAPSFPERVVHRQLWQGVRTGAILLLLGGAVVAIATSSSLERFAALWTAAAVALVALLWVATRRASVCPGCGTRIRQLSSKWCPYCAADLASGVTGPKVSVVPTTPPSRLLTCPSCGEAPGGRGRYGARFPSEGHFCSCCGARLPDE